MAVSVEHLKTIPERVFQQLREAIVEGTIPAGTKISEAELAQTYGISRGPLREAIAKDAFGQDSTWHHVEHCRRY